MEKINCFYSEIDYININDIDILILEYKNRLSLIMEWTSLDQTLIRKLLYKIDDLNKVREYILSNINTE